MSRNMMLIVLGVGLLWFVILSVFVIRHMRNNDRHVRENSQFAKVLNMVTKNDNPLIAAVTAEAWISFRKNIVAMLSARGLLNKNSEEADIINLKSNNPTLYELASSAGLITPIGIDKTSYDLWDDLNQKDATAGEAARYAPRRSKNGKEQEVWAHYYIDGNYIASGWQPQTKNITSEMRRHISSGKMAAPKRGWVQKGGLTVGSMIAGGVAVTRAAKGLFGTANGRDIIVKKIKESMTDMVQAGVDGVAANMFPTQIAIKMATSAVRRLKNEVQDVDVKAELKDVTEADGVDAVSHTKTLLHQHRSDDSSQTKGDTRELGEWQIEVPLGRHSALDSSSLGSISFDFTENTDPTGLNYELDPVELDFYTQDGNGLTPTTTGRKGLQILNFPEVGFLGLDFTTTFKVSENGTTGGGFIMQLEDSTSNSDYIGLFYQNTLENISSGGTGTTTDLKVLVYPYNQWRQDDAGNKLLPEGNRDTWGNLVVQSLALDTSYTVRVVITGVDSGDTSFNMKIYVNGTETFSHTNTTYLSENYSATPKRVNECYINGSIQSSKNISGLTIESVNIRSPEL